MRPLAAMLAVAAASLLATAAVAQSCVPTTVPSLLNPSDPGIGTMSRQATFDYLVNVWFDPSRHVLQEISCPTGTCLWVPWYSSSTSCDYTVLHTDCGAAPDGSYTISCLASDEFSQVGLALSMTDKQAKFDEWVATVRFLVNGSTTGQLPAWLARRNGATLSISDGGDASDATARIITALYTAANNDRFPDATAKASYATLADSIARAFIARDFVTRSITIGGITIVHWLGGGSGTASGGTLEGMDSWSGYYGDVVIALLATYRNTGDVTFLSYAGDTIESYFVAASWDGTNFRVPPWKFKWHVGADGLPYVSCDYCVQWDFKDAPRAVSLCKAPYYAALNGVDVGARLPSYCAGWMQSAGVKADAYQPQYTAAGAAVNPPAHGYYQNGLGAAVNHAWQIGDLWSKLNQALSEFSTSTNSFNSAACMGVYDPAFLIVNLGSAIGADAKAFTRRVCDGGADTLPPVPRFRGTCGYVLDPYRQQITLHGIATDDHVVQNVTYSLSGSTTGSGSASGTVAWSAGPLSLLAGTTTVTVTVTDAAGNWAAESCDVVVSAAVAGQPPPPRRRAARP